MGIKRSRVTSRDVAKVAGVSYNTVSLVIKDSPLVLPETKARVRAAIDKLGYQPNAAASMLRSSRSMTLGYLVHREPQALQDEEMDVFRNRLAKAITECAEAHDYYVLQTTFVDGQRCASLLNSGRIDGLLVDLLIPDAVLVPLLGLQAPIVLVGRSAGNLPVSWVKADEQDGAYRATQHLFELRHRYIGLLTVAEPDHPIVQEREQGFRQAFAERSLSFNPTYLAYGDWSFESGYRECQRLLLLEPRPTALFVLNELMAAGCLQAIRDMGLRVPEDVAVVTVEDSFWVGYVRPRLTAVHVPMYEVGKRATEILLARIQNQEEAHQHVILPTTFVTRDSSEVSSPKEGE